ncbi:MAG: hypothetical protein VSS52_011730 [Thiotrichaceae bacterium]|nr:hypothetical protein [Thiotrichaceae bacterium]
MMQDGIYKNAPVSSKGRELIKVVAGEILDKDSARFRLEKLLFDWIKQLAPVLKQLKRLPINLSDHSQIFGLIEQIDQMRSNFDINREADDFLNSLKYALHSNAQHPVKTAILNTLQGQWESYLRNIEGYLIGRQYVAEHPTVMQRLTETYKNHQSYLQNCAEELVQGKSPKNPEKLTKNSNFLDMDLRGQ